MSCCSKEKMSRNVYNNACKSHSTKSDREMYRICPSKLNKKELEDLYFTLLENNLELKKTINGQQDKIRVLSTQVQRMTNTQDKIMSKDMKECCTTKAFVNEQKDFISELKETNQRMSERIQQLNKRLCSAKQFSKTTPSQTSNSRTFRSNTASPPKKHNCLTKEQDNEQVLKLSASSQWDERTPRKTIQTQNTVPMPLEKRPPKSDEPCDENKCRSLMEDLKIKIVTLQDELFNVHDEYSTRIGRLEAEVSEVRKENIRVSRERSASEHELQNTVKRTSDILAQYRLSEAKCSELATELAIEKRKVAELETRVKAANMSDKVNKTIEDHLTTVQTLPLVCSPKRRDSEDLLAKYSPSKGSSGTSQQVSKSSPTKTISGEMNCETCGCKAQQTSDPVPVHSPTPGDVTLGEISGCKALLTSEPVHSTTSADDCSCEDCPQDLSTQAKDIQCDLCGCASPKNTSTPLKAKNKDVECCCPAWVKAGILKSPSAYTQDENCLKCCFKDKQGAYESPPSKNGKLLSPRGATTRWSPTKNKDSTKSSKPGDDSGYQDTDELVLLKQNKELMTKILELQNQVDRMKIRMWEMSEVRPCKICGSTGSAKKSRDYAAVATAASPLLGALKKVSELPEAVPAKLSSADNRIATLMNSRPLLREFGQEKLPLEQTEYNKSIEGGNYESTKQVPFATMVSDERVCEPGKILSIEILGYPKAVRARNGDDTRAKTKEAADGTIRISDEASFDKLRPLDLMNDEYREHYKPDSHKLKIIEKKKLEIPGSSKLESGLSSLKSPTSDVSGPGFNPEKLKYLEAEGIIAKPELVEVSSSLSESVPSNPELGFGIPRLASKICQEKCKAKSDPGQAKKSAAPGSPSSHQARDDLMEGLPGKMKLPMTEALIANSTAPKQTDESKEDCEYCAACSFDKECELKHENATNHRMNKLAPEMQKKHTKKHDQHNSLQIPGPIPTASDRSKREKIRNLFSRFMEDKVSKQKKEDFVINPTINEKQTNATTDVPANLPDVPLLDKRQHIGTNSIKIDKKIMTHDKKDKSKQNKGSPTKEDLIVNPKINEQYTYAPTDGPISLPDVPLLDKSDDSKDADEIKPSRIVFSMNNNLEDPPMVEVKMPTYRLHSERMLPTLLEPTNLCGKATQIERKADVAQSTDQKLAEKSSQAPTNIADSACHNHNVSLYRRRSGSLCYRTAHVTPDALVCTCAGQQDGYCTDKPRKKAHDKEELKSPRDRRRAVYTSERGTYTLNSKQTDISPDNTDLEMSCLSDLPMEKEKKSTFKSRPLSPGEDRTTTFTNTYSYYSPPTSLSEGEMPATTSKPKHTEPDIDRPYLNATLAHKLETPPAQQMEAALNAISEELRRCRTMMQAHRPAEVSQ